MKKRVTGIGGIFFKAQDPDKLGAWYEKHLGIEIETEATASTFRWRHANDPEQKGATVWGVFPNDTDYFGAASNQLMINYRVDDLDQVRAELIAEGIQVTEIMDSKHGRFAWLIDPEGNRLELWQAPADY